MTKFLPNRISALAILMIAAPMFAQESTGALVGDIKNKTTGAGIPGVQVRISGANLQGVRVVVTNESGSFRAPLLPPGSYKITVAKEGFAGPEATASVTLGQTARIELKMSEAQAAGATVEVIAAAVTQDKTDTKSSTVVSSDTLDTLPRTTRGLDTAALLAPGVTPGGFTDGGRIAIRGGQGFGTRFLLNGTDIADNVFGGTTGRGYYVDDSIDEIQVIQSPVHAKYGNFTGGVINAVTKSGTNEFTGVVRANLSRNNWAAVPKLGGFRKNFVAGNAPVDGADALNREYTVNFGGPILKDRLWFSYSTKLNPASLIAQTFTNVTGRTNIDGSATFVGQSGGPFFRSDVTKFYELKLTWAVTPEHTVEFSTNKNTTDQVNRFYVSTTDSRTLIPQTNENSYWSVGYRGILSSSMTFEGRLSKKHQLLSAGGDPAAGDPIFYLLDTGTFMVFNNGIFNGADGGDNRDIYTLTGNFTWFSPRTDLGSHLVEAGWEVLKQERSAANDQAPNSRDFTVDGVLPDGTFTADPANFITSVSFYYTDRSKTKNNVYSLYVNDVWTLTDQWQLNLGLRYDRTDAADTKGNALIKVAATSPRFQVRFDPFKNQSWIFSGTYAEYVGRLNDGFVNRFSLAGNPITESFYYQGPTYTQTTLAGGGATYAQITNLANYPVNVGNISFVDSPLNRGVNSKIKPPRTREMALGLRRNFTDGSFVNINYVQRSFKDFFNDFFTINGEVNVPMVSLPGQSSAAIREYWDNDPRMKRDYKNVEVEFLSKLHPRFTLGGNYTYAILKGNSTGSEGGNPPVPGDPIGNYESTHAAYGRDMSFYAPYGYLPGDQTHRARVYLNWTERNAKGSIFEASLLFNYTGGAPYDLTRANRLETRLDATTAGNPIADSYPRSYNRFFGPRGIGRNNDVFGFDLKVRSEFKLAASLRYFAEITVFNLFNHQWEAGLDTSGRTGQVSTANTTAFVSTSDARSGFFATPLTRSSAGNYNGFGTYGFGSMAGARSWVLSTGFKW